MPGDLIHFLGLKAGAVARLAGIKYATLDYWLRPERGNLLICEGPANGRGTKRTLGFLDVIRVQAIARLRKDGVSLQTIRKVLAELERFGEEDLLIQTGHIVIAGEAVYWAMDDATLLDVLKRQLVARPLVILPVGEIAQDTKARIMALCAA